MADPNKKKIMQASSAMLKKLKATNSSSLSVNCEALKGKPVIDTVLRCKAGVDKFSKEYLKFETTLTTLKKTMGKCKSRTEKLAKELYELGDRRSRAFYVLSSEKQHVLDGYIKKLKSVKH